MNIFIHLYFYSSFKTFCDHRILKIIREEAYVKNTHQPNQHPPNTYCRFLIFETKEVIFILPKFRIFFLNL